MAHQHSAEGDGVEEHLIYSQVLSHSVLLCSPLPWSSDKKPEKQPFNGRFREMLLEHRFSRNVVGKLGAVWVAIRGSAFQSTSPVGVQDKGGAISSLGTPALELFR